MREARVGRGPHRPSTAYPFAERGCYPKLQISPDPMIPLESLVAEGNVSTPRVPASEGYESASHPEDGVVVDQARRSLVHLFEASKVRLFEAASRVPPHARAKTIMEKGPGHPESAQPNPTMQTKRQTNPNIDGQPKVPWFAKGKHLPFSFPRRIL